MAQQTTTVSSKNTGDELSSSDLNDINNTVNANAVDAENRLTALGGGVAIIEDHKSNNTQSGTFASGAWRTRDLNTVISDDSNIVTLANNEFTLQSGAYLVEASAPSYQVEHNKIRLYNITDSATVAEGSNSFAGETSFSQGRSFLTAKITITDTKSFNIGHYGAKTRQNAGFGTYSSDIPNNMIYTQVKITKIG